LARIHVDTIEHPTTLEQFKNWGQLTQAEHHHLAFLEYSNQRLEGKWLDPWKEVLAVGPFINRKKQYASVPFIIVANYRWPYRHFLRMSQLLVDTYIEFEILPDVHLLSVKGWEMLIESQNLQWLRTEKVSISLRAEH
jgi:hypothetical protein